MPPWWRSWASLAAFPLFGIRPCAHLGEEWGVPHTGCLVQDRDEEIV